LDSNLRSPDARTVVALVATRGRFDLLALRAIPSILAQSRLPDRILIVVDQTVHELPDDAMAGQIRRLKDLCPGSVHPTVLRNRRTSPSAAGAWNTGIDHLHRDTRQPDLMFVAILDDDDTWEPNHLACCLDAAVTRDLNMVASGLIRHETPDGPGHRHAIPRTLDPRELFTRGQHIQGSNLFVRLDLLLMAGGFDERLPSCTDRDLCLRLAALEELRFGFVDQHTVHHYADPRPDRLSTPGSQTKLDGLSRIFRKNERRFDVATRQEAVRRAAEQFGWQPKSTPPTIVPVVGLERPNESMDLVVGFVTDAVVPAHVAGLLDDLVRLREHPGIRSLHIVIVENGPLPSRGARPLHDLVRAYEGRRLSLDLVSIEKQREDWEGGALLDVPDVTQKRLPIAATRSVLNTYVARAVQCRPGAAVWILDDDKRLMVLVDRGDGVVVERQTPDIATLLHLRDQGADVVIGPDTDAAPLPFVATLRVQLLDLELALGVIERLVPSSPWPDRRAESAVERDALRDSYYDLSRCTEHLETPFLPPPVADGTASSMLQWLGEKVDRLLAGEGVFRPLVVRARDLAPEAAVDSVQRGGSAVFFNPTHLLLYPHTLARVGDQFVRRADMLVSQLMRDQAGLRLVMHPCVGVRHDRSSTSRAVMASEPLRQDVLGYALYRAVDEVMQRRREEARRAPLLAWTEKELGEGVRLVRKYLDERLAALTWNAWRIFGLAGAIRTATRRIVKSNPSWASREAHAALDAIATEMDRLRSEFRPSAVSVFAERLRRGVSDASIQGAFVSMDAMIGEYRATHSGALAGMPAFQDVREARARAVLGELSVEAPLRLLGMGGEGVAFTDERRVYKVLDLLKPRPKHDTLATLRTLQMQASASRHLYPLEVQSVSSTLVVSYLFEPSEPYTGGRGRELIALLRECKAAGIVCRNMHPKNLRVAVSGLRLIDYGADIRPFSEAGYRSMAERTWLCWRWSHRQDLDVLMRRALTDKTLPELDGFDRFWRALCDERPSATRIAADIVDPIILQSGASSVLDYGCGKKAASARSLAEAGLRVVGFDPGDGVAARWRDLSALPASLCLTASREEALAAGAFDAVVCSLVLCEWADGAVYERLLGDLRQAVRDGGTVVVTICNPFATFGGPTPLHRHRALPSGASYEDCFAYTENGETGAGRVEFHRPLRRIERDLLRHGLVVERRIESQTVDLERFEPASDFLTLVCRPVTLAHADRSAALVVKTCAMEAEAIERQVEHLVRQLEGPRVFQERVLAIDSRRDAFVRQHAACDFASLVEAAQRLVRHGWIDRVLVGPAEGPDAATVLREWFDLESTATHSIHGAPLATPLQAIASCTADYMLQVDSDLLIGRQNREHDFVGEMIAQLEADESAVTGALNIARESDLPFSDGDGSRPWRVEARGCLLHRERLLAARPLPNRLVGGTPALSWHRSLDEIVRAGALRSLRGGRAATWFVHPPNACKQSVADWMLLLDLVEKGMRPRRQIGAVELVGGPLLWLPRERREPVVFVITGRNVPPGRMRRCLESLFAQQSNEWGAIIVDDGSDAMCRDHLPLVTARWRERITVLQPRERRGQLANTVMAVRHVCVDADSVVVTLDLDDVLIGPEVVTRVLAAHRSGADVTIGSMLRTDKHVAYPVTFEEPRRRRGGNCWQHLRSFRKRLFDAIPDHELRLDGRYVDIAVDWSFMLPIVEMAERPEWLSDVLYLYEPSGLGKGDGRLARERQIGAIVNRPSRSWARGKPASTLLTADACSEELLRDGAILFLRHAERPSFSGMTAQQKHEVTLTKRGRESSVELGRRLGLAVRLLSSPVPRAVETALAIASCAGMEAATVAQNAGLMHFLATGPEQYEEVKRRLGWSELMSSWVDGSLPPGLMLPCEQVARQALEATLSGSLSSGVVAITHDFVVLALLAALRGERPGSVPYLGGVLVTRQEAERFLGTGVVA
jgi:broad specificity phosphatase PhoE/SAM-dependent methyltransferase/glycosyltransferase involved in cell wall biosynthesis